MINNEKEGMEWVYKNVTKGSNFPKKVAITINDANPKGKRSSTESTLVSFFQYCNSDLNKCSSFHPKILAVSTHIFAIYQYLILKRVAYDYGFTGSLDICAPALIKTERDSYEPGKKLAMLLDNLARIFYEICLYKEKTGSYPN
jgi:hypothetical protein